MTPTERLAKELAHINFNKVIEWNLIAKHVQKLILEARIDQVQCMIGQTYDNESGQILNFMLEKLQAELQKQLTKD